MFKGKKKYYPNSVAERLLSDKDFRYTGQVAVQRYLAEQRQDITDNTLVDHLIEYGKSALPRKYDQLYRFAQNQERYYYGLPKSSYISNPNKEIRDGIDNYLTDLEQQDIDVSWFHIGQQNICFYTWFKLLADYALDVNQATLSINNKLVSIQQVSIYYDTRRNYDDEIMSIGFPIESVFVKSDVDKAVIQYQYTQSIQTKNDKGEDITTEQVVSDELLLDLSDLNQVNEVGISHEYVQVLYTTNQVYKGYTTDSQSLISQLGKKSLVGEFYPRVYIRLNQQDLNTRDKNDKALKDTIKICKKLGMPLDTLTEQLIKGIGGDYGDVYHMFINPAIAINVDGKDNMVAEYLFRYFNELYKKCEYVKEEVKNERQGLMQSIADNTYQQVLYFSRIEQFTLEGRITLEEDKLLPVGHYMCVYDPFIQNTQDVTLKNQYIRKYGFSSRHAIYHQLSKNRYRVIYVYGLSLTNNFSGHSTNASHDDSELVIPLDRLLIKKLSPKEKEYVFNKALHIQISLVKVVKKKWYQRGAFKAVLAIIAIAWSYFTAGSGTPLAMKLLAVAKGLIVSTAIGFAIDLAIKLAVKLGLSAKVAGVIALVASVILSKGQGGWGQAFNALNVMKALNTAFSVYSKVLALNIQKVYKDMRTLDEEMQNEQKRLAKAQAMLNTGVIPIDLELLVSPISNLYLSIGESVDEFVERTVHIDVRQITQNIASDFVELSTALPTFKEVYQQINQDNEEFDIGSVLLV